jgi:uncharacterized repeat protein (TIGR01451 family)
MVRQHPSSGKLEINSSPFYLICCVALQHKTNGLYLVVSGLFCSDSVCNPANPSFQPLDNKTRHAFSFVLVLLMINYHEERLKVDKFTSTRHARNASRFSTVQSPKLRLNAVGRTLLVLTVLSVLAGLVPSLPFQLPSLSSSSLFGSSPFAASSTSTYQLPGGGGRGGTANGGASGNGTLFSPKSASAQNVGDITKDGYDVTTQSYTVTLPGRTIQWVVGLGNSTGQTISNYEIRDQIRDGQQFVVGSFRVPPGWTPGRSNDNGANWNYVPVAGANGTDPAVTDLRAVGTNVPSPNRQISGVITGGLSLPAQVVGGGGDGWRPVFNSTATRIFMINHHNGAGSINCVDVATNTTCPGFPVNTGVTTPWQPYEIVDNATNRFYWWGSVVNGGTGQHEYGIACFDMSAGAICGFRDSGLRGTDGLRYNAPSYIGTATTGRVYVFGDPGRAICYNLSNMSLCGSIQIMPTDITGSYVSSEVDAAGRIYYVATGPNSIQLGCLDSSTNTPCGGYSPNTGLMMFNGNDANLRGYVFLWKSQSGADYAVCAVANNGFPGINGEGGITCRRLDGSWQSIGAPPGIYTGLATTQIFPVQGRVFDNKLYLPAYTLADKSSRAICYDFTTQAPCAQWVGVGGAGTPVNWSFGKPEDYEYAKRGKCMYGYGHGGILWSFSPITGSSPCTDELTAELVADPEPYYCDGRTLAQHNVAWANVRLTSPTPPPAGMTSFTADVFNATSGQQLVNDGNVLAAGGLSLAGIPITQHPKLRFTFQGSGNWTETLSVSVGWNGDNPQMCFRTYIPDSYPYTVVTNTVRPPVGDPPITKTLSIPRLAIAKDVDKAIARPGDVLTYTVVVTNTSGPGVRLEGISVTDPNPVAGATLVPGSVQIQPASAGTAGTSLPNLATLNLDAGASARITFRLQLPTTGLTNGQQIVNTATATPPPWTQLPPVDDDATTTIVAPPDLDTSDKTVAGNSGPGNQTRPGDVLTYTVTLRNTGSTAATNVTVTDVLDPALESPPLAIGQGGTYNAATRTITWAGLTVPAQTGTGAGATPGTMVLTFRVRVLPTATDGTRINNTAIVKEPGRSDREVRAPELIVRDPDLTGSVKTVTGNSGPGNQTKPGEVLTYTVALRNSSFAPATNVTVTDPLDPALVVPPIAIGQNGQYQAATRSIIWQNLTVPAAITGTNGTVTPGELLLVYRVQVSPTAPDGTRINNTATVKQPGKSDREVRAPELIVREPDLSGSRKGVSGQSGPGYNTRSGDIVTYTITLVNANPITATGVIVTDTLSQYLGDPVAGSISDAGTYNAATRTLRWQDLTVPAAITGTNGTLISGTRSLTFRVPVKDGLAAGTVIPNSAFITVPSGKGSGEVKAPDLTISAPNLSSSTKGVTGQSGPGLEAKPGDTVTYTITLLNTGVQPASSVVVTDEIDSWLEDPTDISNGGVFTKTTGVGGTGSTTQIRRIVWTGIDVPAVAADGTPGRVLLTFRAKVKVSAGNGSKVNNTGTVGGCNGQPSCTGTVRAPELTVTKPDLSPSVKGVGGQSGPAYNAKSGDTVVYTITVKNSGGRDAAGVVVTDTLSALLETPPTDISGGGTYDAATRGLRWENVSVAKGGEKPLTFKARIKAGVSGVVTNTGWVCSNPLVSCDPTIGDPPLVRKAPDLSLGLPNLSTSSKGVQTVNPPASAGGNLSVMPGEVYTYVVTLKNTGQAAATAVTVTDVLDALLLLDDPANGGDPVGQGGQFDSASRTITWRDLTIPAGGELKLNVRVKVKSDAANGAKINNQAVCQPAAELAGAGEAAKGLGCNPKAPEVPVYKPSVVLKKTVKEVGDSGIISDTSSTGNGMMRLGSTAEYTVRLTNPGPMVLNNLVFTDGYDYNTGSFKNMQGTTYVGNSAVATLEPATATVSSTATTVTPEIVRQPQDGQAAGMLEVKVPSLAVSQTLVIKFRVKISSSAGDIKDGKIENQAFSTSDEVQKNPLLFGFDNARLPSDDPTTTPANDPTLARIIIPGLPQVQPTPTPQPQPTATPAPEQPTPTPTPEPYPGQTGREGANGIAIVGGGDEATAGVGAGDNGSGNGTAGWVLLALAGAGVLLLAGGGAAFFIFGIGGGSASATTAAGAGAGTAGGGWRNKLGSFFRRFF